MQLRLGCQDIRALVDQRRGQTHWQIIRQRKGIERELRQVSCVRKPPAQDRQLVTRLGQRLFERS